MSTPLEQRAEVNDLEALQERRKDILVEFAPLKAMHGPFGLFDHKRKAMVSGMKIKARLKLIASGGKVTDDIVDAEAHVDPQYLSWLDEQMADKVRFVHLEAELDSLHELIRDRELGLQIHNSEIKLAR